MIRPAGPADADRLRDIELAAGARFAEVGRADVAADAPLPAEHLMAYAAAGRSWVATDEDGEVVAYVIVDPVDGCAHVEQISVHPDHQGRGLGRALLDTVERWAAAHGMPSVTLCTFTAVPWNAPLYTHLGFRVMDEGALGPGLRRVRDAEAAHGLDPAERVCMNRPVRRAGAAGA